MKLAASVLLLVALSGCATRSQPQLEAALNRLVGQPESALLERYGEPDARNSLDGQRWLTWNAEEHSFHEGYWLGYENDSTYVARCRIRARVQDAKVVQVLQEGNIQDCWSLGML